MLSRDGLALMGLVGSSRPRRTSVSFDFLDVASAASVAGRWSSPRPPRSFRSPGDPRGFPTASPSSPPHLAMWIRVPAFLVFAPLQSCMTVAPVGATRSPLLGLVRSELGWTSLSNICSSVPALPSIDMLSGVHSHLDVATETSGSNLPDPDHVPTLWFLTTSPVCAAIRPVTGAAARPPFRAITLRVAGLLHPAANRGVHRVSGRVPLLPGVAAFLAMLYSPSKDSPHPQPYRVTTACCPPAVPSPRCSNLPGSRCRSRRSIRITL